MRELQRALRPRPRLPPSFYLALGGGVARCRTARQARWRLGVQAGERGLARRSGAAWQLAVRCWSCGRAGSGCSPRMASPARACHPAAARCTALRLQLRSGKCRAACAMMAGQHQRSLQAGCGAAAGRVAPERFVACAAADVFACSAAPPSGCSSSTPATVRCGHAGRCAPAPSDRQQSLAVACPQWLARLALAPPDLQRFYTGAP